jgi:hypothetical protein
MAMGWNARFESSQTTASKAGKGGSGRAVGARHQHHVRDRGGQRGPVRDRGDRDLGRAQDGRLAHVVGPSSAQLPAPDGQAGSGTWPTPPRTASRDERHGPPPAPAAAPAHRSWPPGAPRRRPGPPRPPPARPGRPAPAARPRRPRAAPRRRKSTAAPPVAAQRYRVQRRVQDRGMQPEPGPRPRLAGRRVLGTGIDAQLPAARLVRPPSGRRPRPRPRRSPASTARRWET